jgi:hypothetical protein
MLAILIQMLRKTMKHETRNHETMKLNISNYELHKLLEKKISE